MKVEQQIQELQERLREQERREQQLRSALVNIATGLAIVAADQGNSTLWNTLMGIVKQIEAPTEVEG